MIQFDLVQTGVGRMLAEAPGVAGAPAGVTDKGSPSALFMAMLPFLLIFGIFWFLVIGPQRKQQKETETMQAGLKKGDQVVTSGGHHGTVVDFREADKAVVIEFAPNVRHVVSRSHVASIKRQATPPAAK